MAKERNWYILIPIVLNLLVLVVLPTLWRQNGPERTLIIAVAALGWPWLMYFVIGRIIEHTITKASQSHKASDHEDFV